MSNLHDIHTKLSAALEEFKDILNPDILGFENCKSADLSKSIGRDIEYFNKIPTPKLHWEKLEEIKLKKLIKTE